MFSVSVGNLVGFDRWNLASPGLKSTAKISFKEKKEEKKRRWDLGLTILRMILCVQDLSGVLSFMKTNLEGFVNGKVSSCSIHSSSSWGIHQTSRLQTAVLSSRSFIVFSGRLREWLDVGDMYLIGEVNDSWAQGKWRASVIHLDPNTRIIEYWRSVILENSGMFSAAFELLEFITSRLVKRMKKQFWLSFVFGEAYGINFRSGDGFAVPA
ncbi:hypothetical protein RJ641_021332 [Dillenia turbinata]|uniref:Uncharacterized protein n=1 Tax=Dillenia turbinata TaxID=194707 RepID=A0AAN8YUW4_9MAGN